MWDRHLPAPKAAVPAGLLAADPGRDAPSGERRATAGRAALARWLAAGGPLHAAFIGIAVYLYTGAKFSLDGTPPGEGIGGFTLVNSLLQALVLGVSAALALADRACVLRSLRAMAPLGLLVVLAAASALWSVSPEHTLRRSLSLATLLLFVATTQAALGQRRFLALVLWGIVACSLASVAEAVLRPAIGFDVGDYADAIRGIYATKNGFGATLLEGAFALAFLALARGRPTLPDLVVAAGLAALLVLSRSTTALLLSALIGTAVMALLWIDRGGWRRVVVLAAGGCALVVATVLVLVMEDAVFDLLGKDSTLTGRTFLWEAVWPFIAQRPLLGSGYAAFWLPESGAVQHIWYTIGWEAPTAHSGYLDLLLQLGWLGLLAMLLVMLATGLRAARAAFGRGSSRLVRARGRWALIVLLISASLAYYESSLFNPDLLLAYVALALLVAVPEEAPRTRTGIADAAPAALPPRPGLTPVRLGQRFTRLH